MFFGDADGFKEDKELNFVAARAFFEEAGPRVGATGWIGWTGWTGWTGCIPSWVRLVGFFGGPAGNLSFSSFCEGYLDDTRESTALHMGPSDFLSLCFVVRGVSTTGVLEAGVLEAGVSTAGALEAGASMTGVSPNRSVVFVLDLRPLSLFGSMECPLCKKEILL
jgi:hypothetical protein